MPRIQAHGVCRACALRPAWGVMLMYTCSSARCIVLAYAVVVRASAPRYHPHPWQDELAASVTREQGKTLADARGDVFRGLGELLLTGCGRSTLGGRLGVLGGKGAGAASAWGDSWGGERASAYLHKCGQM